MNSNINKYCDSLKKLSIQYVFYQVDKISELQTLYLKSISKILLKMLAYSDRPFSKTFPN